jgi:Fe-S oxidoreductase
MIGPMPEQRKALKSLMRYGNPYGFDPKERIKWAEELEVPLLRAGTHVDVILYVGCTAAYDFRLQKVAKAVALLMKKTQVRFAVIEDELCCGNPAHSMGDEGLFRDLSEKNVKQFNALGVGHIVTVSPHCFHTFLNEYPEAMRKIKVQHYTQFLADLTSHRQTLPIRKSRGMKKAVFHDPCYLGKHNSIYGEPRTILKSIPGLSLVEMKRSKQDSLCCGGGGGRMWADFTKEGRLSDLRIKEAMDAGAEAVVTACPFCIIHFEDAVKALAVENTVSVYDVAEYLAASLDSDEPFPS